MTKKNISGVLFMEQVYISENIGDTDILLPFPYLLFY